MEIAKELLEFALDLVFVFIGFWVYNKGYKQGYQDGLHDRKDELKRKIED